MTPRLFSLGIVLTGAFTLAGCALVVGGLWFAYSALPPSSTSLFAPADPNGPPITPPADSTLHVGAAALDFSLPGLDRQVAQLSQFHGKALVLNFWATWCGPCSAEMPNLEKVYQTLSHDEVVILAVNQGEFADQVRGYADLYHLHFPILIDDHTTVGHLYRVQALPTTVFIDRNGIVREIHIGGPMSEDFIRTHIQTLLQQSQ